MAGSSLRQCVVALLLAHQLAMCADGHGCGPGASLWPLPSSHRITPIPSRAVPDTLQLSIGAETMDRNFTVFDQWRQYLGPMGVKRARIQLGWARTEVAKGEYAFGWLDEIITNMSAVGVRPWAQLSFGNPVYPEGGSSSVKSPLPTGAAALAGWKAFVTAVVSRYAGLIHEWEVWNEPDVAHIAPQDYAAFVALTAPLVRAVQPNATVYFQVAGGRGSFITTALAHLNATAPELLPTLSLTFHPYTYNPDDSYQKDNVYDTALQLAAAYRLKSVMQGENGAPSTGHHYGALGNYNWTETSQAKWALRRLLGDLGYTGHGQRGLASSLFSVVDMCYNKDQNFKGTINANCTSRQVLGPKRAYHAVQNLAASLAPTPSALPGARAAVNGTKRTSVRFFTGPGGTSMAAVWVADQTPGEYVLADCRECCHSVSLSGVSFGPQGSPLQMLDLLTGSVYKLPASTVVWQNASAVTISPLPLYDSPVLVAPAFA